MSTQKVLLAFSGGIDSCTAARILQEQGYEVSLLTLNLFGDEPIERATETAKILGLPLTIERLSDRFRQEIIDYFTDGYRRGETPAPCTRCNTRIKWRALYETACREGFDRIATGHYFRILQEGGIYYVRQALDPIKDQSYYLWGIPQEMLKMALTPMGDRIKSEVVRNTPTAHRAPESMGVCFLQGSSCSEWLKARLPDIPQGEVVDLQGDVIGRHDGYPFYTIGQKRNLHCDRQPSVCTLRIDPRRNRIVAGSPDELFHGHLFVREYYTPNLHRLIGSPSVRVKIRGVGRNPEGFAHIRTIDHLLQVDLENPAWAPAPGQPVVFYDGDLVVGGGILDHSLP